MIRRPIVLALNEARAAVRDAARGVGGTFMRLRLATERIERLASSLPADEAHAIGVELENIEAQYRQAIAGHEKPNRAGRKPKQIGSGVWVHAHNGDPELLDEEVAGGLVREIAGPHRLDVQAKVGRRDASALAKAWMATHPPLSEHARVEVVDAKAGEDVARWVGVPRKRGGGYQWEAQARPRKAPPVRRGPPAGYVPWRKEPQYLFDDPTYRQRAELTAAQYGIAPGALAPMPLPPPPRRAYTFSERGQGQLFNAAGRGRRRRRRRNACGCGG